MNLTHEDRRVERLVRAAFGVGHTHAWFVALPRDEQESKVREFVAEALERRDARLAGVAWHQSDSIAKLNEAIWRGHRARGVC